MKAIFIIAMIFLTGCAGGSGGGDSSPTPAPATVSCGELAGHYLNDVYTGETLDISNSCTMTDSICGYQAHFTEPDIQTGATILTVINTNGTPGCMSNTAHSCEIGMRGGQLGVSCDNGAHVYIFTRQ